ncbi:MAG TPA: LysE family translocator [Propionicimonas sp.]|uniref:LysE family translocator n=1 Tax=Propionicimonas sp. TaxID=1955623 RepID=UPI002F3F4BCA
MTLIPSLLGFTLLAAVVTVTPGLDTVLVLRQALRSGRRSAFAAAAGICLGALVWGVAAAAGVAALFVASQVAYAALRWAGVAFLLYLAWSYLRAAFRGGGAHTDLVSGSLDAPGEAFVKGLLTDLLNPKMAVFYLTVLPLFLPAGYPPVLVGALLAGVHACVAFAWFTVIIVSAHAVRGFLTSRRGARVIDGSAGVAMLGFGLVLGLER